MRFLYSQRILVSDDGWKYVFTPGDGDELYDLTADPHEMTNLATAPGAAETLARLRAALMAETARFDDPLRDCVAKFNGQWRTGSGQFDATSAYLTGDPAANGDPANAAQPHSLLGDRPREGCLGRYANSEPRTGADTGSPRT